MDKNAKFSEDCDYDIDDRELKKEYYKGVFQKYDEDASGFIELPELRKMLKEEDEVSRKIAKKVFKVSDQNDDGRLDINEFVDMVHNKNFRALFGDYVNSYVRYLLPKQKNFVHGRKRFSYQEPVSVDGTGRYEEQCSCCPPPVAMIIISILEIAFYVIDEVAKEREHSTAPGKTASVLMYNPYKRFEFWRFLTYMFVHIGHLHLVVNLAVQIMLGVPLEMVHGWWRILTVYFAGVIMGSLVTSITDPNVFLAGASGGVYSLITAHIASILMNWKDMTLPGIQLFIFILITVVDVGTSVYNRYFLGLKEQIGYAAHFGGALAGLLVGIWVLKNLEETKKEKYIWWIAFVIFAIFAGVAITLNFVWTEHFP